MAEEFRLQAPELHDIEARPMPADDKVAIGNATVVNVQSRKDYELTKIGILIPGGRFEFGRFTSLGALLSLKEGTKRHSGEEIAEAFDYNGAEINFGAGDHYGLVAVRGLRRNFDKILPLVFEMLSAPSYPATAIDAVRRSMVTNLQVDMTTPTYHANVNAHRQIAGAAHPFGQKPDVNEILSFDAARFDNIRHQWLNPGMLKLYACGAVDDQLLDMLGNGMEQLPIIAKKSPVYHAPMTPCGPCIERIEVEQSLQHSVLAWVPATDIADADYWPLRIAVQALGGYFGSRLMQNVREDKGYTYGISASLVWHSEAQFVQMSCECDGRYTERVIDEIRNELTGMAERPLTADEFSRVKLNLNSWLASMSDTPESIQARRMTLAGNGMPADYYDRFIERLKSVTPEQIAEVSSRYLQPDGLRITVAG